MSEVDTQLLDPRLEADLASLLTPEHSHWAARAASFVAIPAAVALLAALAAVLLQGEQPPPVTLAVQLPTVADEPVTQPTTPVSASTPAPAPTAPAAPAEPAAAESENWVARAEGLAAEFAVDYLGWSALPEATRPTELARYLAPGLDPAAGWHAPGPLVAATPIVVNTVRDAPNRVTVTVAVRITGQDAARWVNLAVPVGRDSTDQPAVVDLPRLVPAPHPGTPAPDTTGVADPGLLQAVQALVEDAARTHLATLSTETGFVTSEVHATTVLRPGDGTPAAAARIEAVLVDTVTTASFTQALWIDLRERPDGTWEVTGVR